MPATPEATPTRSLSPTALPSGTPQVVVTPIPTETPTPVATPTPVITPAPTAAPTPPPAQTYIVQEGDTLSAIATRFGTSVSALVDANSLANADDSVIGQRLIIR